MHPAWMTTIRSALVMVETERVFAHPFQKPPNFVSYKWQVVSLMYFYAYWLAEERVLLVETNVSQNGGSLLAYVVSRLRPDVFSHSIWVNFGDKKKPLSSETIEEFLSATRQLQKDDPVSACQILLICAVHQNYSGQRGEALKRIQQILALAEQYQLANEFLWACWGAIAICVQQGDFEQAVEHLQSLQARLRRQDEWVLANFIETVEQSLCQRTPNPESGEPASFQDSEYGGLMRLTFEWLKQWGFSAKSNIPEFQAISIENNNPNRFRDGSSRPLWSNQSWHRFWFHFKQIMRGELKLMWVANGAHYRPDPVIQRPTTYSPPSIPNQPEDSPPTAPRNLSQDHPQSEPALQSFQKDAFPEASLLVYCLGTFRVYINDQLIEKWPGNKCRQVLKYLVVHRETPVNQEILMEQFWPGIDAKSARRNLYQAVYNLRQALQSGDTDASYVLTEDNHYCLNPELGIWVDSEAFDSHYQSARNLIASGCQDEAMQEFEAAENLYQGEFLAEDRYEDWPLVHRENLKNAYLDAVDQLSQHFYKTEQFATCIYYCRKILTEDNCREDAHRRVMLCYINLDQSHLALRQYQNCVEALRNELGVPPMTATEELYKQIIQKRYK